MAWEAKKSLLKGGVAWSAKKIPIKRSDKSTNKDRKTKSKNILEEIDFESNEFLKNQKDNP